MSSSTLRIASLGSSFPNSAFPSSLSPPSTGTHFLSISRIPLHPLRFKVSIGGSAFKLHSRVLHRQQGFPSTFRFGLSLSFGHQTGTKQFLVSLGNLHAMRSYFEPARLMSFAASSLLSQQSDASSTSVRRRQSIPSATNSHEPGSPS
jgi:hypothetical protein